MKSRIKKRNFALIGKACQGFTLIELLVVITISLTLTSVAIVGYRNFANRRVLTDSLKDIKDQLRLVRSKAIHGEKPSFVGTPPNDECISLLYYQVDIEVVEDGDDKVVWTPVCEEGSGIKEEHEVIGVDLASDGNWPINIVALEGTANKEAVINVSYKDEDGLVTVSVSGNIQ